MNSKASYSQFHQQLDLARVVFAASLADLLNNADFEKPHRIKRGRQFAPITADAEWELSNLPTCCDYLYRYCIRVQQPGTKLELYLEEFRDSLAALGITYAAKYIRQCFHKLVRAGLIKILRKWIGGVYLVLVRHAGIVENTSTYNGRSPQKPDSPETKYDKTESQSRMISFPYTKIFTEKQQEAAATTREEENQRAEEVLARKGELQKKTEGDKGEPEPTLESQYSGASSLNSDKKIDGDDVEPLELPQENPEKRQIILALRDAGILSPELKALTLKYTLAEVLKAINALMSSRKRQKIENPGGWVSRCLRGEWWKLNQQPDPTNKTHSAALRSRPQTEEERKRALESERLEAEMRRRYPPELTSWYALACKAGIVDGLRLDYLPIQNGEVQVHLVTGPDPERWLSTPWTIAAARHPLTDHDPPRFEAVEIPEGYESDPDIQRQIRESLGEIPGSEPGENLDDPPPE